MFSVRVRVSFMVNDKVLFIVRDRVRFKARLGLGLWFRLTVAFKV